MTDGNRDSSTGAEEAEQVLDAVDTEAATENAADADGTADSSTAEGPEQVSTLDAVKQALETDEGSPASGEAEDEGDKSDNPDDDAEDAKKSGEDDFDPEVEPTEDELQGYKPKTRKRIEHLMERSKELAGKVEALEPQAKAFQDVQQFVTDAGLGREEVNELFNFGALAKRDPKAAYEIWKEYGKKLEPYVGATLTEDLQRQVERGEIAEDAAKRLSELEANNRLHTEREAYARQQAEARAAQDARQAIVTDVQTAVSQWDAQWSASDPDSGMKRDLVLAFMRSDFAENGYPRNGAVAKERMDSILVKVNKQVGAFRPQQSKGPVTPISGSASVDHKPQPTTTLEAINQALGDS